MHTFEPKDFRDKPLSIDSKGKRRWIEAKQPKGKWYKRRTVVAWFLLSFLIVAPFIHIKGEPFMLLDVAGRKFHLFGVILWAQDTFMLAMAMLVVLVSIVLFTVAFGRIWCGWACPQTLFLEMVFRRVEFALDALWSKKKAPKETNGIYLLSKHFIFFMLSLFFTLVFVNWFTGPEKLLLFLTSNFSAHWALWIAVILLTVFYYWIYAHFREQVCTMICPYGRIQGVLLDARSLSVIYDYKRGEPRGAKAEGACIDCGRCYKVCPTGIDIRNGHQLECIHCAACVDECNQVMNKLKRPGNLIRYDSPQGIEKGGYQLLNARTIAYSSVLLVLFSVLVATVAQRKDLEFTLLRVPGTLYQTVDSSTFSNLYQLKVINKTAKETSFQLQLIQPNRGTIRMTVNDSLVKKQHPFESVVIIQLPKSELKGKSTPIEVGIYHHGKLLERYRSNFIGPEP